MLCIVIFQIVPMIQSPVTFNHIQYELEIFDTPGGETAFDNRIRHEIYDLDLHLLMICFAIDDRNTFENIRNKVNNRYYCFNN